MIYPYLDKKLSKLTAFYRFSFELRSAMRSGYFPKSAFSKYALNKMKNPYNTDILSSKNIFMDILFSNAFVKYEIAFLGINLIYIVFHILHSLVHTYLRLRNFL